VTPAPTIETAELRVGMFVHLDLGWMSHPFALSSFRIADASQIATIRSLGLARVRWSPEKSDGAVSAPAPLSSSLPRPLADTRPGTLPPTRPTSQERDARHEALAVRRAAVDLCQRQYAEAAHGWRQAADEVVMNQLGKLGGTGGVIAIGRDGTIAMAWPSWPFIHTVSGGSWKPASGFCPSGVPARGPCSHICASV